MGGEAVPGDDEFNTELLRGRSASSIDMARDKRPKPTRPASIGKPETKIKHQSKSINSFMISNSRKPMPCKKNCMDFAKTSG